MHELCIKLIVFANDFFDLPIQVLKPLLHRGKILLWVKDLRSFDQLMRHAMELVLVRYGHVFHMQGYACMLLQLRRIVDYLGETARLLNHGHLALRDPLGRLSEGNQLLILKYQLLSDVFVRFDERRCLEVLSWTRLRRLCLRVQKLLTEQLIEEWTISDDSSLSHVESQGRRLLYLL